MFSATRTALKQATSVPLRRTRDPLLSSPNAQHFLTPSGSHFIVRPPPTPVPASHPLPPPTASTSTSSTTVTADNTPFAALFSSSSSSLLPSLSSAESSLPSTHAPLVTPASTPSARLSPSDIAALQTLRLSSPSYWTRSRIAAKFGVSQQVVGTLGWGEGSEARRAERERREQVERRRERVEGEWGWKKSTAREERRRRRNMW